MSTAREKESKRDKEGETRRERERKRSYYLFKGPPGEKKPLFAPSEPLPLS